MSKAMHAKPFRLTGPYTGRHARPESPRSKLIRAVSLGLACVCLLLTATVYPASAATSNTSMASLQSKLDKLSQSINQHKKELSDAKKKESAAKALESELKERVPSCRIRSACWAVRSPQCRTASARRNSRSA